MTEELDHKIFISSDLRLNVFHCGSIVSGDTTCAGNK
jgi:hypothetical protein